MDKSRFRRLAFAGAAGIYFSLVLAFRYCLPQTELTSFVGRNLDKLQQWLGGYGVESALWAVLLGGLVYATLLHMQKEKARFSGVLAAISIVFGILHVCGLQMHYMDALPFFHSLGWLVMTAFLVLGWAALMYLAGYWLWVAFGRLYTARPSLGNSSRCGRLLALFERHPFLISFAVISLGWAPWVLAYYPASMDWDVYRQMCSAMSWGIFARSNHDPWLASCVLTLFYRLGVAVGNQNLGLFLFVALRNLLCAALYANCVRLLRRAGVRTAVCVAVTLFYAATPVWGAYAKHAFKDTLSAALFCGYITCLIALIRRGRDKALRWQDCGEYILLSAAVSLLRNNPIYAVLPATAGLVVWLLIRRTSWVKALSLCLGAAVYFCFNFYIFNYGNVGKGSPREALSLPFQQTARTVKYHGDEVTQEERDIIDRYLDYGSMAQAYDPVLSDPVKDRCKDTVHGEEAKGNYLKVWAQMLPKHFDTYVEAGVGLSYGYYAFTPPLPEGAGNMNSGMTIFDWVDVEWFTQQYDFDFHYVEVMAGLRTALHQWAKVWGKLPLAGLTDTIAVYTWFTVLAGGWLLWRKRWPELLVVLAMGVMILTCIASPVNGAFRYYCPVAAAVPALLLLLKPNADDKNQRCE